MCVPHSKHACRPHLSQLSSDAQAGREEGSEGRCLSAMANAVDIACEQRALIFAVNELRLVFWSRNAAGPI